jgi:chromosome condensin MukBEF ATPase and DNA-binding subunit MukB
MNANELADELDFEGAATLLKLSATMLRQQQAEIEALQSDILELTKAQEK